jgi:hypothetical protein
MLAKYRRWGWLCCLGALACSAMYAGCEVAKSKWGCALLAGAVMVGAAALLVVKLTQ